MISPSTPPHPGTELNIPQEPSVLRRRISLGARNWHPPPPPTIHTYTRPSYPPASPRNLPQCPPQNNNNNNKLFTKSSPALGLLFRTYRGGGDREDVIHEEDDAERGLRVQHPPPVLKIGRQDVEQTRGERHHGQEQHAPWTEATTEERSPAGTRKKDSRHDDGLGYQGKGRGVGYPSGLQKRNGMREKVSCSCRSLSKQAPTQSAPRPPPTSRLLTALRAR